MAKRPKAMEDINVGQIDDPAMRETLQQDMQRRMKIRGMFPQESAEGGGAPAPPAPPKAVPTDKHWQEVEAEIQKKRATVRGLRTLKKYAPESAL